MPPFFLGESALASEIDIVNLALARLGDVANVSSIDPPEGSAQADHAARFYPVARDGMLEMIDWKFSIRRVSLAVLGTDVYGWAYSYAKPANCIKIIGILPPDAGQDEASAAYETETDSLGAEIILSDTENAVARYTVRVTDTGRFPPLFVEGLSWMLASHLAGPVLKGTEGEKAAQTCYARAVYIAGQAGKHDAGQRKIRLTHTPTWVANR